MKTTKKSSKVKPSVTPAWTRRPGLFIVVLVFAVVGVVTLARSLAAPVTSGGSNKSSSSISIRLTQDINGNGLINWGDSVAFVASTTWTDPNNYGPWLNVGCVQNRKTVYTFDTGYGSSFPGGAYNGYAVPLKSDFWTGGAADCTASLLSNLDGKKGSVLASMTFHVNP